MQRVFDWVFGLIAVVVVVGGLMEMAYGASSEKLGVQSSRAMLILPAEYHVVEWCTGLYAGALMQLEDQRWGKHMTLEEFNAIPYFNEISQQQKDFIDQLAIEAWGWTGESEDWKQWEFRECIKRSSST